MDSDRTKTGKYAFADIEARWQRFWEENRTFRTPNPGEPGHDARKPKYYILDMFPYPSGSGLHVGHPEGYTATDILARYKRMKGFNVLHPMGFDAFGLPAEQYAIAHNVHPADVTHKNIENMRRQIKLLGFSYDWDREVATCGSEYYRWTQWIFLQLFNSWYDEEAETPDAQTTCGRARPVSDLAALLEKGERVVDDAGRIARPSKDSPRRPWSSLSSEEKRTAIDRQRLAYLDEVPVNWCPALGTVLANEEVTSEGRSERGNHPVYRRPLRQWLLRITKYADRLEHDLHQLDWPESIKQMQRNWIGRSSGAEVDFLLADKKPSGMEAWRAKRAAAGFPALPEEHCIRIYTTRPDTLFGATYMVLAPEHPLVRRITTEERKPAVEQYATAAVNRSDLDRTAETKEKTGVFTGAYAVNPVDGRRIPIWVADYVLMGYGTGAIMAVPGSDTRDYEFAQKHALPIVCVVAPPLEWLKAVLVDMVSVFERQPDSLKEFLLQAFTALNPQTAGYTDWPSWFESYWKLSLETKGETGVKEYLCSLVSYWKRAYTEDGMAINSPPDGPDSPCVQDVCDVNRLPTAQAKAKIVSWLEDKGLGKAAVKYKLRDWVFSRQKYWGEPFPILHGPDGEIMALSEEDLPVELPPMDDFRPAVNQADPLEVPEPPLGRAKEWARVERDGKVWRRDLNTMPQWAGSCWYYLRYLDPHNRARFCDPAAEKRWMPVDLYVGGAEHAVLHLLYARFWHKALYDLGHVSTVEPFQRLFNQGMITAFCYKDERGVFVPNDQVEHRSETEFVNRSTGERLTQVVGKMAKSLKNVVNPDDIIVEYGADTFRLYEMYMGPLEASKPWNTRDVPGPHRFLNRLWRLAVDENTGEVSAAVQDVEPDEPTLRLLHKAIKKIGEDTEQFKFNTAIAAMFEFVNEMTGRSVRPRAVIEAFVKLAAPYAPHIAEELWQRLGHADAIAYEPWPEFDPKLAVDDEVEIPIQIQGKVKARLMMPATADAKRMEELALANDTVKKLLAGKTVRKVIAVPGRMVNIVAG